MSRSERIVSGYCPNCKSEGFPMSTPVALDAAIEEAKIMSEAWDRGDTDAKAMFRATRKLLSALSADRRLEEADGALTMLADRPCAWEGSEQHDYCAKALTANVCSPCIARRYFAEKGGER